MKRILFLLVLVCLEKALHAQTPRTPYIYTIKADSVKITNTCDTAELIIENHTQTVPGFLFNKGRGRTEFRRLMQGINDTMVMIGPDTLRLHNPWLQGGNRFGTIGVFGTMDYNPIDFYTGGLKRARLTSNGSLQIGNSATDNGEKLQVYGNIYANGDRHLLGNLAIVSNTEPVVAGSSVGIRVDDVDYGSMSLQGSGKGYLRDMFVFSAGNNGLGKDVYTEDQSIIRITSGIKANNKPDNSLSILNIQPEYNLDPSNSPLPIRGIYYKPKLTSLIGSRHIAIETVTGDVLLGTTSGNTGIGTSMPSAQLHTTGTVRFGGLTKDSSLTRIIVSDGNGYLYYKDDMAWLQGGNRFGTTGKFGTLDTNHIDFYTNNVKQGRLTNTGNLLLGTETDYGYKLAVEGTTYSKVFTNSPALLGGQQGDGAIRLRWGGGGGTYIEFYNQGNLNRRGYICTPSDTRPLGIVDNLGFSFFTTPFVSVGTEDHVAKLTVDVPTNSTSDAFGVCRSDMVNGYLRDLTVKNGNTIVGNNSTDNTVFDNGTKLQVIGSAYVRDTLKLPNLVSQTDMAGYKPLVADASGNVYKMSGWNASAARKSATVSSSSYTVPADVDVVFVNYAGGTATISLPSGNLDREITIKNLNTTNTVAVSGLDASESNTIATRGAITVKYTGSAWVGISKY